MPPPTFLSEMASMPSIPQSGALCSYGFRTSAPEALAGERRRDGRSQTYYKLPIHSSKPPVNRHKHVCFRYGGFPRLCQMYSACETQHQRPRRLIDDLFQPSRLGATRPARSYLVILITISEAIKPSYFILWFCPYLEHSGKLIN